MFVAYLPRVERCARTGEMAHVGMSIPASMHTSGGNEPEDLSDFKSPPPGNTTSTHRVTASVVKESQFPPCDDEAQ